MFQHALHRNYVGVHLTPRQRFDGGVDDVGAVTAHLQNAGHRQARTRVAVVLNDDLGVLVLNHLREFAQHGGLTDAGHILQADFGCAGLNQLVGNVGIILSRVYG